VERVLAGSGPAVADLDLATVLAADGWARRAAAELIDGLEASWI
jgi:hypothetical protein